jgi:hypothetical protein
MVPQNISASNQMQRAKKYYKEYDKLGCDLIDMWRRLASRGRGLQTCPNCRIHLGESAHKSNSEFNSSPIRNPREVDLKTDARSHTTSNQGVLGLVGKIRRLSFQWDLSHIQLKSESTKIYKTCRVSRTRLGVVTRILGFDPCIMSEPNRGGS